MLLSTGLVRLVSGVPLGIMVATAIGVSSATGVQRSETQINLGLELSLESSALGQTRTIMVSTPSGYDRSEIRYPVLFVLDGEVHFLHAVATARFLARYLRVPEMIVVGVRHPNRGQDFIPPTGAGASGGDHSSARFLRFLTEEVRPYLDRRFRTAPYDVLVGHSLGGLFSTHTVLRNPDAFGAHIIISPSLYWNDSALVRTARAATEEEVGRWPPIFLALGGQERPAVTSSTRALDAVLSEHGLAPGYAFEEFPRENHLTVPPHALPRGLRIAFNGWGLPFDRVATAMGEAGTLRPFDSHFERLSDRFGYPVDPAEIMFSLTSRQLGRDHPGLARQLIEQWVTVYPRSPDAHDQLAQRLEADGDPARAVAEYEEALALARAERDPAASAIEERLRSARARR